MQIFRNLSEISKQEKTVLTLGTFDGIHLGHMEIIRKVVEISSSTKGRSILVTFDPHPRKIISEDFHIKLLTTTQEKLSLIEKTGIDNIFIINFTKEFSQQSAEQFIRKYFVNGVGLSKMVVGYDHHFGKGRGGDVNTLGDLGRENNFTVETVGEFEVSGEIISSTKIRKALTEGDVVSAAKYLGRPYSFSGTVIAGDKRGRELGYPTANIQLTDEDKLLPALGIYLVEVLVKQQKYFGLLSVGRRPTFYESGNIVAEVFIYNFSEFIYKEVITVSLLERIRSEIKFDSADELIRQMDSDRKIGLELIARLTN